MRGSSTIILLHSVMRGSSTLINFESSDEGELSPYPSSSNDEGGVKPLSYYGRVRDCVEEVKGNFSTSVHRKSCKVKISLFCKNLKNYFDFFALKKGKNTLLEKA